MGKGTRKYRKSGGGDRNMMRKEWSFEIRDLTLLEGGSVGLLVAFRLVTNFNVSQTGQYDVRRKSFFGPYLLGCVVDISDFTNSGFLLMYHFDVCS
jgi:hypothetical protein